MKPISQILPEYINDLDVNARSRAVYTSILKLYIKWLFIQKIAFNEVSLKDIIRYKQSLIAKELSVLTIDNYLVVVRSFYMWAARNKYCDNVAQGVKLIRKEKMIRKMPFTKEEINKLFSVIKTDSIKGKRDYAIISILLYTGMRAVEVSRLNIGDLNADGSNYSLQIQRKGSYDKNEVKLITPSLYDTIENYLTARNAFNDKSPMFSALSRRGIGMRIEPKGISELVREYLEKAGIHSKKHTCHSLRHTAGTYLILEGFGLMDVQAYLGHKNIVTSQIYTQLAEKMKRNNINTALSLETVFKQPNRST